MSKREAKIALTMTWDEYRPQILSSIAKALAKRFSGQWVAVTSVLPHGLPPRSWRTLFKNAMEVGMRPTEYIPVEGYYLFRHKFGNAYFLWCLPRTKVLIELDSLVDRAMKKKPNTSVLGITELQDAIDSECLDFVKKLNKARLLVETIDKAPLTPRKRKAEENRDPAPVSTSPSTRKIRKCLAPINLFNESNQETNAEKEAILPSFVAIKKECYTERRDEVEQNSRFWDYQSTIDFSI